MKQKQYYFLKRVTQNKNKLLEIWTLKYGSSINVALKTSIEDLENKIE